MSTAPGMRWRVRPVQGNGQCARKRRGDEISNGRAARPFPRATSEPAHASFISSAEAKGGPLRAAKTRYPQDWCSPRMLARDQAQLLTYPRLLGPPARLLRNFMRRASTVLRNASSRRFVTFLSGPSRPPDPSVHEMEEESTNSRVPRPRHPIPGPECECPRSGPCLGCPSAKEP